MPTEKFPPSPKWKVSSNGYYGRGRGGFEKGLLWNNRESVTHQTWDDMDNRQFEFKLQRTKLLQLKKLKKHQARSQVTFNQQHNRTLVFIFENFQVPKPPNLRCHKEGSIQYYPH